VSASASVSGSVVLEPRDPAALTKFVANVTNPKSSQFHGYLPAGAFAATFGPTKAAIASVKSALASEGLTVTGVASDDLMVNFRGSARTVEKAFGTGLESYKLANGSRGQATTSAIRVPSTIKGVVASVVGLDNLVHAQAVPIVRGAGTSHQAAGAPAAAGLSHPAGAPKACADATSDAQGFGGLTDDQIARAYGAFGLYSAGDLGAGQRIAVYEEEPFARSDIKTFDTCYFGATAASAMSGRLHVYNVDGGQPSGPGSGEAVLDIEDVSAIAPQAQIDVYQSPGSSIAGLDEYAAIVNADRDQTITSSWGLCEQAMQLGEPGVQQTENLLFEQAAAQGQSVFAAAGDTGDDSCNEYREPEPPAGQNPLSVLDPASQPYVVGVGGTTINDATQPPAEQVWNDGADWGSGGGGISQSWAMPSWQQAAPGAVLPGSSAYKQAAGVETAAGYPTGFCQAAIKGASSTTACRTVPDVSAQADEFTGAVTIYSNSFAGPGAPDGWITIGGTSSATPIWAALVADVNASPTCKANPVTKNGVGFVSPLLYAVASNPTAYAASFNDITTGNNDIYGLDNGRVFPATKGYDLASGLGSPQLTGANGSAGLAAYLCSMAASTSRPSVTHLSPAALSVKGGKVTITGSGFRSGGKSDVSGIQVGNRRVNPDKFSVESSTKIVATFPNARDTLAADAPKPQDGAGPAEVIITLTNGQSSTASRASTLQYVDKSSHGTVPAVTGDGPSGGEETSPGTVRIYGSGFTGATKVTFGGVKAASFKVLSSYEVSAKPAHYSSAVSCAASVKGESPTTDICQVQVRVSNSHGTSAAGKILKPLEGVIPEPTPMYVDAPPAGCGCELATAPTEYDFYPKPTITSVSTRAANPASLASEEGGSIITVRGRGLNWLTTDWANFGSPSLASSQDYSVVYETGKEVQIEAPGANLSIDTEKVPVSFFTIGGLSNQYPVTFAGVPVVNSVATTSGGLPGAPDTGGTAITLKGRGFSQAVGPIIYSDAADGYSLGTQYSYTVSGDTKISTQTVSENPGVVDVLVCTVTDCSYNPPNDEFDLFPPGNPHVTSVTPDSGPAAGGTSVTITGENLGCVTGVFFGKVAATKVSNAAALLDCGSTTTVTAKAPKGTAGTTVPVTVTTVESALTPGATSTTSASFTYGS
jgi:hypothetical protein